MLRRSKHSRIEVVAPKKEEELAGSSHEDLHTLMKTLAANVGNTVILPVVAVVVLVTTVLYRRYL